MAPSGDLPDELPPGTRLGARYVVHKLVGSGGMSQVYLAEHESIARKVAIKVLHREPSRQPRVVLRFQQEARAASTVQHENVVEVTDFGQTDDGRPFMVMEYLDGEDLGETLIREAPLSWVRARPMLLQILAALQAAHDQGLVHRDIKPENVFRISRMGSDDFVKVIDFGIAKVLARDPVPGRRSLTLTGHALGTPAYMAPEQCVGDPVDARTDLYAVGVLAYQMLTGRTPFEGKRSDVMRAQVYEPVPPMASIDPDIDPEIDGVVLRALEKLPGERYATAFEFADALFQDLDLESSTLLPGLRRLFMRRRRRG
ncbi:serine/threonine-protein kinase [Paraliomyxa miuraensis]|uniref:serine/threonine-protein kinase n=1 Tax=Paraliomyxa miuraensis TaxID=376150 RepID=UPI00225BB8F4|nr:serine/threonine-protein kinase [Paraliomyxa miuraensis]MCX4243301.1 serine/threonine protein kinase [Paraliomyxa miuraensis]